MAVVTTYFKKKMVLNKRGRRTKVQYERDKQQGGVKGGVAVVHWMAACSLILDEKGRCTWWLTEEVQGRIQRKR